MSVTILFFFLTSVVEIQDTTPICIIIIIKEEYVSPVIIEYCAIYL